MLSTTPALVHTESGPSNQSVRVESVEPVTGCHKNLDFKHLNEILITLSKPSQNLELTSKNFCDALKILNQINPNSSGAF